MLVYSHLTCWLPIVAVCFLDVHGHGHAHDLNSKKLGFDNDVYFNSISTTVNTPVRAKYDNGRLLMLSLDGFRLQYFDFAKDKGAKLPNLEYLITNGAFSEMAPSWPSMTFANHFTMATGLYPGEHGVLSSLTECPHTDGTNHVLSSTKLSTVASSASPQIVSPEPLWLVNARTGVYFWPCSHVPTRGRLPFRYMKDYNESIAWEQRVDTLVDWFAGRQRSELQSVSDRINLGMLYYHEPDFTGHKYGPDSEQILAKLLEIDKHIGYLIERLKLTHLTDTNGSDQGTLFEGTNILLVSDHGMSQGSEHRLINVGELIRDASAPATTKWTFMSGEPIGGSNYRLRYPYARIANSFASFAIVAVSHLDFSNELLRRLNDSSKHVTVYTADTLRQTFAVDMSLVLNTLAVSFTASWTFDDGSTLVPLLLLAEPGWNLRITALNNSASTGLERPRTGSHGYHNYATEMRVFALGFGPAFRKGYMCAPSSTRFRATESVKQPQPQTASCDAATPLRNTDLYSLVCNVLHIDACRNSTELRLTRAWHMLCDNEAATTPAIVPHAYSLDTIIIVLKSFYEQISSTIGSASPMNIMIFVLVGAIVLSVALTLSIASCHKCRCRTNRLHSRHDQTAAIYRRRVNGSDEPTVPSSDDEDVLLSFTKRKIGNGAVKKAKGNNKTRRYNMESRSLLSASQDGLDDVQDDEADRFI